MHLISSGHQYLCVEKLWCLRFAKSRLMVAHSMLDLLCSKPVYTARLVKQAQAASRR